MVMDKKIKLKKIMLPDANKPQAKPASKHSNHCLQFMMMPYLHYT
jgi:hypothetical protein